MDSRRTTRSAAAPSNRTTELKPEDADKPEELKEDEPWVSPAIAQARAGEQVTFYMGADAVDEEQKRLENAALQDPNIQVEGDPHPTEAAGPAKGFVAPPPEPEEEDAASSKDD